MQTAACGRVSQVKDVPSQGVTRIIIELPIEAHVRATQVFYGQDVLVVPGAVQGRGYGVHDSEDSPTTEKNAVVQNETESFGHYYQALYKSGFFNNPRLWAWAGTDKGYQEWVRKQPSVISKCGDWVESIGEERCEYAHVRRAADSGTGIKPAYWGIPLRHEEHKLQHQQGESSLGKSPDWFEKKAVELRTAWVKSRMYVHFNVTSLADLDPVDFIEWAMCNDFYRDLPAACQI